MIFKASVTKDGVHPAVWFALGVAEALYSLMQKQLVVTSLKDSHGHRPASLHNQGRAADIRTKNLPLSQVEAVYSRLKAILDPMGFDVVLEHDPPHLHLEYDPKNGENWLKLEVA